MEYLVSTSGKTFTKRADGKFINDKLKGRHFDLRKIDLIAYKGKNKIMAEYIAVKSHYNTLVKKGESNEYGMVMLIMDIKYYEDRYPEWCI